MKTLINKLKSKVLTYLFKEWVDTEFDLETLGAARSLISVREKELKLMIDIANRTEFRGYREMYNG